MRLYEISAIIDQVLLLESYYFPKHGRIIKHFFLGKAGILGAYCDICSYMLHIVYMFAPMLDVFYQYKNFVNIDINDLNVLLSGLLHKSDLNVLLSELLHKSSSLFQ